MSSKRLWHNSRLSTSVLYVEETTQIYSDGMPTTEASLLATICKNGPRYDARIYVPSPSLIRGFVSLEDAQKAVCNYLSTHEYGQARELS